MTPAELERRIDAGVAAAKAAGWRVRDCIYFVPSMMECCALSACVLDELAMNDEAAVDKRFDSGALIERSLQISSRERTSFVDGFDGVPKRRHISVLYDLGARMRAKYIEAK